ncbi:hypothetical protein HYN43_011210 [Mucilaginibacter celer]|uniref:Uncharacterized protein n=1 Tax=Mucilaginibacter celer TaxID=2305508 RepID=A0A494VPN8_9SPHI|nr:hypothetical protein HYN43_011210 [Mucilaginibacter celer]
MLFERGFRTDKLVRLIYFFDTFNYPQPSYAVTGYGGIVLIYGIDKRRKLTVFSRGQPSRVLWVLLNLFNVRLAWSALTN